MRMMKLPDFPNLPLRGFSVCAHAQDVVRFDPFPVFTRECSLCEHKIWLVRSSEVANPAVNRPL